MKRYVLYVLLLFAVSVSVSAQSMTDDQVMKLVMKEHERGASQSEIVTKLMQNGVDISQIRRVKKTYERMSKGQGLGQVSTQTAKSAVKQDDRTRANNGEKRQPQFKVKDLPGTYYSQTQEERQLQQGKMEDALNTFAPDDSLQAELLMEQAVLDKYRKRVFGRDIFNKKNLSFEPNMNIATPANYRLGPGDAVYVEIYGASQKTVESTVSPDGTITIEGYGPVQVNGLTVSQANARLRSTVGSRYSSSQIRLTVGQTRTIMVNVMGEVKAPGTYTLSAFATVFHALYMAGGINDLGTLRNIKVYRGGKLISAVDIYDYILNGKLSGNVRLTDNDVIVVGPYDCLVSISGKVKRPMYYEMKKNESISTLLRYSGGFTGDAYKKSVRVVRKTGREHSIYNVGEFEMASFRINDGDSVSVDSVLARYENMAEIKGAVFRPGMYQVGGDINSVRTLIEHAEGVTEEAFTAHAVMHRMKEDRTLEVIPVDVAGIMSGKVADIPLKSNDVLFIPDKSELVQDRTITIHGEVQYPGIYRYADNETLEDFILQAGGLKNTAPTVKVDVARRVSNPKALDTDSLIARTYTFALKEGFVIDGQPGFTLQPYDEVYVRRSPGYSEQRNVAVEGEVMFAGTYTLTTRNQRLSDILKAAGGAKDRAYIKGARLERRVNETERVRMQAVMDKAKEEYERQMIEESQNGGVKIDIANSERMKKFVVPDYYPVGIELDKALAKPGCDEDLVLREGDRIVVPQYTGTVKVNGSVMYPNTIAYKKGKGVSYYVDQAGGFSSKAKKGNAYIVYMNGMVSKVRHNAKPEPGCEIVIPEKSVNKMSTAEKMTIGTSVASIATMIATLANIIK